ncbi:MAG: alkaline phosphatase family protein [Acidobacteriota bacterium]
MKARLISALLIAVFGLSAPSKAAPVPAFRHIFIIMMENKEFGDIVGNPEAPYLNDLVGHYGQATNAFALTHPSLPNYMALTSGQPIFGGNCATCQTDAPGLADSIEAAGRTWKQYLEDMTAACAPSDAHLYVALTNPFVHYKNIAENPQRCSDHLVPLTQLGVDLATSRLPDLVWVTPNLCSQMHDCSIGTGDAWLKSVIPAIVRSPEFADSVLFIAWDEGRSAINGGGHVPLLVVSPFTRAGFASTRFVTHYDLLRTILDAWRLPPLGQSANAKPLSEFFPPPAINTHPSHRTAVAGSTVTFTTEASGLPAPTYSWQWSADGGARWTTLTDTPPYSGAQTSTLAIIGAPTRLNSYWFRAIAANGAGATTSETATLTVTKATPILTWPTPAAIASGTPLSASQLNATASVAGTFAYTPAVGAVFGVGAQQTLSVSFTPIDSANYTAPATTVAIDVLAFTSPARGGPPTGTVNPSETLLVYNGATFALVDGKVTFPDCTRYLALRGGMLIAAGTASGCSVRVPSTGVTPPATPTPATPATAPAPATQSFKGPASGGAATGNVNGSETQLAYNGATYPLVNGRVMFPDCTVYIALRGGTLIPAGTAPGCATSAAGPAGQPPAGPTSGGPTATLPGSGRSSFSGPASGGPATGAVNGSETQLAYNGAIYELVNGKVTFPDCTVYIALRGGILIPAGIASGCFDGGVR